MAHKIFVNKTGHDFIATTALPRIGSEPGHSGEAVNVGPIKNGESKEFSYGDNSNPYLNGFTATVESNGSATTITQIVTERGSAFDDTLNTNNTVTFTSFGGADTNGSNS